MRLRTNSGVPTGRFPGRTLCFALVGLQRFEQVEGLTVDELDAMFVDGRSSGQGDFVPIDFEAVVKARTGRNKVTLQVLWGRYTASPAGAGQRYYSYERFRQLVAQHVNTAGVTARITHAPGHTMQVDWAGTKMRLFDPLGGQGGKLSVFVASLPYSGMLFAVACPNERQDAWLDEQWDLALKLSNPKKTGTILQIQGDRRPTEATVE